MMHGERAHVVLFVARTMRLCWSRACMQKLDDATLRRTRVKIPCCCFASPCPNISHYAHALLLHVNSHGPSVRGKSREHHVPPQPPRPAPFSRLRYAAPCFCSQLTCPLSVFAAPFVTTSSGFADGRGGVKEGVRECLWIARAKVLWLALNALFEQRDTSDSRSHLARRRRRRWGGKCGMLLECSVGIAAAGCRADEAHRVRILCVSPHRALRCFAFLLSEGCSIAHRRIGDAASRRFDCGVLIAGLWTRFWP